jgi:hypothetical protein
LCCRGLLPIEPNGLCETRFDPTNPENLCDSIISDHCKIHKGDPLCSCYNAQENGVEFPECTDDSCKNVGWMSKPMRTKKCPPILNCTQTAKINSTESSLNISQNQYCGVNSDDKLIQQNIPTMPAETKTKAISVSPDENIMMYAGIGAAVSAVIVVIVSFLLYKKFNKNVNSIQKKQMGGSSNASKKTRYHVYS